MSAIYRAGSLTIPPQHIDFGAAPKSPRLQVARSSDRKCSLIGSRDVLGSFEQVSEGTGSNEVFASVHFLGRQGSGLSKQDSKKQGAKKTALLYEIQSNEDPSEHLRCEDDDTDSSAAGLSPSGFCRAGSNNNKQIKSMNFAPQLLDCMPMGVREGSNEELELSFIMDDPEEKPANKCFMLGTPTSINSISGKKDHHLRERSPDNISQSEGVSSCEQLNYDHDKELSKLASLHKSLMEKFERSSRAEAALQRPAISETCIKSNADLIARSVPFRNKFSELTTKNRQV